MNGLLVIGLAAVLQVALGRCVAPSWWVPDLLLIAVVGVVMDAEAAPWGALVFVAGAAAVSSARDPWLAGILYLFTAAVVWWLAHRWDLEAHGRRVLVIAAVECVMILLAVSMELVAGRLITGGLRVWAALLGWAGARVAVMSACAWAVIRLARPSTS